MNDLREVNCHDFKGLIPKRLLHTDCCRCAATHFAGALQQTTGNEERNGPAISSEPRALPVSIKDGGLALLLAFIPPPRWLCGSEEKNVNYEVDFF